MIGPRLGETGFVVAGAAGSGKTETLLRLTQVLVGLGRRIIFLDCKGTDPDLSTRLAGVTTKGPVHLFPDEPINGWLGDSTAIYNRLVATQVMTEPYYEAVLQNLVRLSVGATSEGWERPKDSTEFLSRLSIEAMTAAYRGTPHANTVADLRADRGAFVGARVRMANLMAAIGTGLDGTASYDDSELFFARLSWAAHADVVSAMAYLLEDISHWCSDPKRKPRRHAPVTLIVDELSAVPELAPKIMQLAERGRDVGMQVIVTVQSYEGLGSTDDERSRMLSAMAGGVIVHQCSDPEPFLERAGTVRRPEMSWQLDETTHSGRGSLKMAHHMKINPDDVRRSEVGEAWLISAGRYLRLRILKAESDALQGARLEEMSRRRGRSLRQAQATAQPHPEPVVEVPSWLEDL